MMNCNKWIALVSAVTLTGISYATAIELGDPAPPLQISKWVKGKEVDLKKDRDKNVYVIEFWATWCGPCLKSIPHLSQMQAEFKDKNVTIIGVSDETPAKVVPFVERMGDKMNYTVALDQNQATYQAYMEAFGEGGIPHAFVVDSKGNLVWHGHPMGGLDQVIQQVLAGTFDLAAAQKAARAEKLVPEYLAAVADNKYTPEVEKMGWQVLEEGGDNSDLMNEFAWAILTHPRVQHRDLKLATAAAKKAYSVSHGKNASIIDTYARALFDTGKKEEAIRLQKQAISICTEEDLKKGLEQTLERYLKSESK